MESILEAIGNTPLVLLRRCVPENGAELWLKLEYRNPTGSMKDRMALAMIEGAERAGLISPGDTVVEYTGGATGPALALVLLGTANRLVRGNEPGVLREDDLDDVEDREARVDLKARCREQGGADVAREE